MTAPRSSLSKCTSSMISNLTFYRALSIKRASKPPNELTDASSPSPVGFRVTTSHFSGVVTIICVSAISARVSCISPTEHYQFPPYVYPRACQRTSKLPNADGQPRKPLSHLSCNFRCKRLHRRSEMNNMSYHRYRRRGTADT